MHTAVRRARETGGLKVWDVLTSGGRRHTIAILYADQEDDNGGNAGAVYIFQRAPSVTLSESSNTANESGGSITLTATDDSVVATAGPVTVTGATEVLAVSPNVDTSAFTQHHVRIAGP